MSMSSPTPHMPTFNDTLSPWHKRKGTALICGRFVDVAQVIMDPSCPWPNLAFQPINFADG